jgi:hypothetical protein
MAGNLSFPAYKNNIYPKDVILELSPTSLKGNNMSITIKSNQHFDWLFKFSCHKDFPPYNTMSETNLKYQETESSFTYFKKHYLYVEIRKKADCPIKIVRDSSLSSLITFNEIYKYKDGN